MTKLASAVFLLLFVLHHDFWLWGDDRIVLGFVPIGLAYHAAFSVATAAFWLFVVRSAWPRDIERWAEGEDGEGAPAAGGGEGGT